MDSKAKVGRKELLLFASVLLYHQPPADPGGVQPVPGGSDEEMLVKFSEPRCPDPRGINGGTPEPPKRMRQTRNAKNRGSSDITCEKHAEMHLVPRLLALGKGAVYTSNSEVRVPEDKSAKLSCSYSGFSSPRVEWKFAQGDITSLVCYNNKITTPFEDRVTFSNTGITFLSVTRKDTGMYTCMVSDEGGTAYGEVSVQLIVLVPPSKPTVNIPSSATIGSRAVLTCSEPDGSPPSEYLWYRDGALMPLEPKGNRAFSNSSYSLNPTTGELVFDPVSASDTGEYSCQAQNGHGSPVMSAAVRMEAVELNVGGIVAAVLVTLLLLGLLVFGIWFAYSRGYFDRKKKGTESKKVIYSQPTARSEGEFRQTSSFLV